jgi:hypothetical protein
VAGRTPTEAVHNYLTPLQEAVSCVCTGVLSVGGGYHPRPDPHALLLNRDTPVRLQTTPPLWLSIAQHYRIIQVEDASAEPWKVETAAYRYELLEADEREILIFHWHPEGQGLITFPHLHLQHASRVQHPVLQMAHIPTGRVAVEDVIRLTIREFGARPLRDDWDAVLTRTQAAYDRARRW